VTPDRVFNWYRYNMDPATLVSVEEYLHTDYSPDCDFVDGVFEDRNVGQKKHALSQRRILVFLIALEAKLRLFVLQEQRVRIAPTRYSVPDICVMLGGEPDEEIFTTAPFLCVEVLSPNDRMSRMETKITDYLNIGVRYVWVIDPYARKAWSYTAGGRIEVTDGMLRTEDPDIEMPLSEALV
jgi:Uma2 family endonuclease